MEQIHESLEALRSLSPESNVLDRAAAVNHAKRVLESVDASPSREAGEADALRLEVAAQLRVLDLADEAAAFLEQVAAGSTPRLRFAAHARRLRWRAHDLSKAEATSEHAAEWQSIAQSAGELATNTGSDAAEPRDLAEVLYLGALAWVTVCRSEDAESYPDALPAATRLGATLFEQYARSKDSTIRRWVIEIEAELRSLHLWIDAPEALSVADRDLALGEIWSFSPATFFVESAGVRVRALLRLDRGDEALRQLAWIRETFGTRTEETTMRQVAMTWSACIVELARAGRGEDALAESNAFVEWFDVRDWPAYDTQLVRSAMQAEGVRVRALERAIDVPEEVDSGVGGARADAEAGALPSLPLTAPEVEYAHAVRAYVERFAPVAADGPTRELVSELSRLANHQRMRRHFDDSAETYQWLFDTFLVAVRNSAVREELAHASLNYGFLLLMKLSRPADAVAVYDRAIGWIGDPSKKPQRVLLSKLQASRAAAVGVLHDRGEEVDEENPIDHQAREEIRAAIDRGRELSEARRHAEAIAEFDTVIDRFPDIAGQEVRMRVIDAMVRKGYCIGECGEWQRSVDHHQEVVREFSDDLDMTVQKDLALALHNLARAFDKLGRHEEEISTYAQIFDRWHDASVPYLSWRAAKATWMQGVTEADLGRINDAERSYERSLRYLRSADVETRIEGVKGAVNLSILLRKDSRADRAVRVSQESLAAIKELHDEAARTQRTKLHVALARAEAQNGRVAEAQDALHWLLNDPESQATAQQKTEYQREFVALDGGVWKSVWKQLRGRR